MLGSAQESLRGHQMKQLHRLRAGNLRKVKVKIYLIALALESFGEVEVILQSIRPAYRINPYPQSDGIHASIPENGFNRPGFIVPCGVLIDAPTVFEHLQRTQVMTLVEERLLSTIRN